MHLRASFSTSSRRSTDATKCERMKFDFNISQKELTCSSGVFHSTQAQLCRGVLCEATGEPEPWVDIARPAVRPPGFSCCCMPRRICPFATRSSLTSRQMSSSPVVRCVSF